MKQKSAQLLLFSSAGTVLVALLLVAVNFVFSAMPLRYDFTQEKLYTLSDGTRSILADLDTPVAIRFYYSKDSVHMPVYLKNYARRVEDLLDQYEREGGKYIQLTKLNPAPDTLDEDKARLDGVRGQNVGLMSDPIYLGIAVNCADSTSALPFLSPDREAVLEYELTRAIHRVLHPEKPALGLMTALPVQGMPMNPAMPILQQRNARPWLFHRELAKDFDVRDLPPSVAQIDDDISVLVVIHPRDLSEQTLFAIDQFVLRGGRLIAFLDPVSTAESRLQGGGPMGGQGGGPSSLGPLLDAWGVTFDTEQVVADNRYATSVRRGGGPSEQYPTVLSLSKDALTEDDPVVGALESLVLAFAGTLTCEPPEGLTQSVLFQTSDDWGTAPRFLAQMGSSRLDDSLTEKEAPEALALRLDGTFKTAFPNGAPGQGNEDDGDDPDEDAEAPGGALTESAERTTVVLLADADMLMDDFCVQFVPSPFGTVARPISDNISLLFNLVEQLGGGRELASIRSRGVLRRPFTKVQEMEERAAAEYEEKIAELEAEREKLRNELRKLRDDSSEDGTVYISDEQRRQIEEYTQEEVRVARELRETRRKLRRRIDALGRNLALANAIPVPFLLVVAGVMVATIRKRRMSAR